MFGYPHLLLSARGKVLPQFSASRIRTGGAAGLNRDVRLLQRVVVDPRYRGVGIARRLIRHGLAQVDIPYVECVAQMGEFSDFLLNAGFVHAGEIAAPPAVQVLTRFAGRHGIELARLIDARSRRALMKSLPARVAAALARKLDSVARSRIQTGFGSLRKHLRFSEPLLRKALARLHAHPAYFLWTRGDTP
jgi:GNAT superfamily N-acetyltransferase